MFSLSIKTFVLHFGAGDPIKLNFNVLENPSNLQVNQPNNVCISYQYGIRENKTLLSTYLFWFFNHKSMHAWTEKIISENRNTWNVSSNYNWGLISSFSLKGFRDKKCFWSLSEKGKVQCERWGLGAHAKTLWENMHVWVSLYHGLFILGGVGHYPLSPIILQARLFYPGCLCSARQS